MLRLFPAICLALGLQCATGSVQAATGQPLNHTDFTQTFGDEFSQFDWRNPNPLQQRGLGTWTTNFLLRANPNDAGNRSLTNNGEKEIYVDQAFTGTGTRPLGLNPFSISDGKLEITANVAPPIAMRYLSGYHYTSGLITTRQSFSQTYGLFEIRAKMPAGKGLWPAFWLLPTDGSWPPEIDGLEVLEDKPTTLYVSSHTKDKNYGPQTIAVQMADTTSDFHLYSVDWEPKEIVFYVDNKEVARQPTPTDMIKPMYMLANLAVGGNWPGDPDSSTRFPATFTIDYIRAYKHR